MDLVRGDGHPNPHIKALAPDSIEVQIQKIEVNGLDGCLYPTKKLLKGRGAGQKARQRPFTRELILGAAQLEFRVFDLRFLEFYRNDPRYFYKVDEIHGSIQQREGTKDQKGRLISENLEFLEFGFAYDRNFNRAVAIFLRYLHDLPAAQQKMLKNFQLNGDYKLHPDFYRTQIIGDFPERVSIYDALLEEKNLINQMCLKMNKPRLFRTDNKAYERPTGFGILIRPTSTEFRNFVLLLDQLLSDDIDVQFFQGDIAVVETLTRYDGSKIDQRIGTITLLENWFNKKFRSIEPEAMKELFRDLRKVRNARQKPAHKVDDTEYNQKYLREQRALMNSAFNAVRTIRMIFENHPNAKSVAVPEWIRNGKVWEI